MSAGLCVCFDGVIGVSRGGKEDLLVSIVPVTSGPS